MPIQIHYEAPRIYLEVWSGKVTLEEIERSGQEHEALMLNYGEIEPAIVIIDGTNLTGIPFEIRQLQGILNHQKHILALFLVKAPLIAQIAARLITTLDNYHIELFDDVNSAIARAETYLSQGH